MGLTRDVRASRGLTAFGTLLITATFAACEVSSREGLNNPHLGRNAIGCGSKIRFEDLSER